MSNRRISNIEVNTIQVFRILYFTSTFDIEHSTFDIKIMPAGLVQFYKYSN
jgi:hypothetical protein